MVKKVTKITCPLEHDEQKEFIKWTRMNKHAFPDLDMIYAVPNGGLRNEKVAIKLTREGVQKGIPDLVLPVARGCYHGLYIEMKRLEGKGLSKDQEYYMTRLLQQGYLALMARGWIKASEIIKNYYTLGAFCYDPLRG